VPLERCRRLVDRTDALSDEQILALRTGMEAVAAVVCDMIARKASKRRSGALHTALVRDSERSDFEERAAIMEFDGGESRVTAERGALRLVVGGRAGGEK